MTDLKHLLIEELLNALDDIQTDVPYILDYYLENDIYPDNSLHMDIDMLTMNITNLRDSARCTRNMLDLNGQTESDMNVSLKTKQIAFAMFMHIHMLTDPDSIYNSGIICNSKLFES